MSRALEWYEPKRQILHDNSSLAGPGTDLVLGGKYSAVTVQVVSTADPTLTFKGSIDGLNFANLLGINQGTGAVNTASTAAGVYIVPAAGISVFRAQRNTGATIRVTAIGVATPAPIVQLSKLAT